MGIACFMGYSDIVRELASRGARVNVDDNSAPTSPLSMAIRGQRNEVVRTLIELGGTQATLEEHNLDRHWRNARTHTLHDPVRWKYHVVGNYHLNGVTPPRSGAL